MCIRDSSKANTMWYDVVIRDEVPEGLEILEGTISLRTRDGRTVAVPDAAYDPFGRLLAVAAGDLRGVGSIELTFDALVTEEAVKGDVGNVAAAFGTTPAGVDAGKVGEGVQRPGGGTPFTPEGGWPDYEREDVYKRQSLNRAAETAIFLTIW